MHLAAYRPEGVKTARLQIVANGQSLFNDNIILGMWKATVDLTGVVLGDRLTLELISDTFVPAGNRPGASDDGRVLGVQVFGVTLVADPAEGTKP